MTDFRIPVTEPELAEWLWTLRDARKQQGLTLKEVADRIAGFPSLHEISNWEHGRFAPSLRKFRLWARALGYELTLTPIAPVDNVHTDGGA